MVRTRITRQIPFPQMDLLSDFNDENIDPKKNTTPIEVDTPFIGLKQIAYIVSKHANNLSCGTFKNVEQALELFELARHIDPSHSYVNTEAIIYEQMGNYDEAEKHYQTAILYDDELAMYNLADMYEQGHLGEDKKKQAIDYYEMAAHHNYPAAITKTFIHYSEQLEKDTTSCENILHLAKLYVKILEQEKKDYDDDYQTENTRPFNRDFNTGFSISDIEIHKNLYNAFKSHTVLSVILHMEKIALESPTIDMLNEAQQYLTVLCKEQDFLSFRNKMILFTRLNNLQDCPICYENKINIDVACGHTFCGSCYARVHKDTCPLCRADLA